MSKKSLQKPTNKTSTVIFRMERDMNKAFEKKLQELGYENKSLPLRKLIAGFIQGLFQLK